MKNIIKCLSVLAITTQLQANVIELPLGSQIATHHGTNFFDEDRTIPWTDDNGQVHNEKGWVSRFGALDGGSLFDSDLAALDPTAVAHLSWNLEGSGFLLRFIVVNDGQADEKIYQIGLPGDINVFEGTLTVSPFDSQAIRTIGIYGRVPGQHVPESEATLLLFLLGLAVIVGIEYAKNRNV